MKLKIPDRLKRARHNKTSRGMTATAERSNHSVRGPMTFGFTGAEIHRRDVNSLYVHGTCDKLRGGTLRWMVKFTSRGRCKHCGSDVKRLELNQRGKQRLRFLRKKKMKRGLLSARSNRNL